MPLVLKHYKDFLLVDATSRPQPHLC